MHRNGLRFGGLFLGDVQTGSRPAEESGSVLGKRPSHHLFLVVDNPYLTDYGRVARHPLGSSYRYTRRSAWPLHPNEDRALLRSLGWHGRVAH